MAQAGNVYVVNSNSRVDFTGTLAQNAGAIWHFALPAALGARSLIRSITIQSVQNLDWEVYFFKSFNGGTPQGIPPGGTIDNVMLAGKYRFFVADGLQIAATGQYFYYIGGLQIQYHDLDSVNAQLLGGGNALPPFLNVVLVNRNVTGKSAGDAGAVVLRITIEPTNA